MLQRALERLPASLRDVFWLYWFSVRLSMVVGVVTFLHVGFQIGNAPEIVNATSIEIVSSECQKNHNVGYTTLFPKQWAVQASIVAWRSVFWIAVALQHMMAHGYQGSVLSWASIRSAGLLLTCGIVAVSILQTPQRSLIGLIFTGVFLGAILYGAVRPQCPDECRQAGCDAPV